MEQKDYFLREIEKIGLVFRTILGNLLGKSEDISLTITNDFEKTNEQLFKEIGFDLKYFLRIDKSATNEYLRQFKGIKAANLELLAEILFSIGIKDKSEDRRIFLEKALQLYELCEMTDKTYSFDRYTKIKVIKNVLASSN